MALSNRTELIAAIGAGWLNRTDLDARIPDFITLVEAKLRRELRVTTVRDDAFAVDAAVVAVPTDFAEPRSLRLITGLGYRDTPLKLTSPENLAEVRARYGNATGRPTHYAVLGDEILFAPTPDQAYVGELIYYASLTPLTPGSPTNDVLTASPDLYLFGVLLEAAPYLEHDEREPMWDRKFRDALAAENKRREDREYAATPKQPRLPVVFG